MSDVRFKMWKLKTAKANIISAPKLMYISPTNVVVLRLEHSHSFTDSFDNHSTAS